MADFSHLILRDILGEEIDFESPVDEDLMLRIVSNMFSVATMVDGRPNSQFKAQANGTPTDDGATSTLTIDTITEGVFERNDQYNTKYILITSGPASGQGIDSRFPIVDSIESSQEFVVGENQNGDNLAEAGMVNNDTFQVMGHVHDGVDGEKIRVSDIELDTVGPGLMPKFGIIIWDQSNTCPAGFTRYTAFDDKFLQGKPTRGGTGGTTTHNHGAGATGAFNATAGPLFDTDDQNHLPPFHEVLFCQKT